MTARKSTRKATTKKATSERAAKKAPAAKKATRKRAPATKKEEAAPAAKKKAASKGVSSTAVNMGNLFALRPRVNTSFRQEDFLTARRLLEEESYGSLEEAARAVAERALELSNDPKGKRGQKRGR